ncbi:MAG: choice-of-anchor D domain-containing protein, partial [Candidatus Cloacimonadaceae bacterium]|nr:choice-of-anchor D domain-containing protein [Candidatus Cloacimonadaceae bacterium]
MILEASIDGGNSWNYVAGDSGLYNNTAGLGPIGTAKWSGNNGGWSLYSTALNGLAHQPQVRLRFRFASDSSVTDEGFAIDDIRIWNHEYPSFAVNPSSHDFGRFEVGQNSYTQYFQISNAGGGILSLHPANISIEGLDPEEFDLSNLIAPVDLSAGQTALISVIFSPSTVGQKTASLVIREGSEPLRSGSLASSAGSFGRNIHVLPLSGFGYQNLTENVPFYEGFSGTVEGNLPLGWESSNPNWWVNGTDQAGGNSPEMFFGFDPHVVGDVTMLSPMFDTTGLSQIQLSFRHKASHLSDSFDLRLYAIVGSVSYQIDAWMNVNADLGAQSQNYQLTTANHGVGANNLRLAFVFNGDSYNVNGWHLDDIVLGGSIATLSTQAATQISHYAATLNAQITSGGGLPIQGKGFFWGTDPDPQNNGIQLLSDAAGDNFSAEIEGLEPGSLVYYIAFADNPRGRAWGSVLSFQSLSPQLALSPAVLPAFGGVIVNTTSAAQSFSISGTNLLGDVTISAPAGFGLSSGSRDSGDRYSGELVLENVDGLLAATLINVCFLPTASGPISGDINISSPHFATVTIALSGTGITLASLRTNPVSEIGTVSARTGGSIIADGWSEITACGICWSTNPEPTLADFSL